MSEARPASVSVRPLEWTDELEGAYVHLCEWLVETAHGPSETQVSASINLSPHLLEAEQALTLLHDMAVTAPPAHPDARQAAEEMRARAAKLVLDARGEFGSVALAERIMGLQLPGAKEG